jgi:O-antigen/teichoic acid export membrane protein
MRRPTARSAKLSTPMNQTPRRDSNVVFRNAGITAAQTAVSGALLFGLYRYLLVKMGPANLGIWSVVLATTSASRIGDFGLAGSVVRFIAKHVARREPQKAANVIQTAFLSVGAMLGVLFLLGFPLFALVIRKVVPATAIPKAMVLVPYALGGLWLSAVGGVFLSALDGFQRFGARNAITVFGNLLYFVLAIVFVPRFGLLGLGYVQLLQSAGLLVVSWIALKLAFGSLPVVPYRWDRSAFREMIGYGVNIQAISIANILFDLITKSYLARFGGLGQVGYYDMASRMVMQFRLLLVSANQALVPFMAGLSEQRPEDVFALYSRAHRMNSFLVIASFGTLFCLIPAISQLWIGSLNQIFIRFAGLLTIGWAINSLNGPAYFANLGTGRLMWNTVSQLTMGIVNATLGLALGFVFGGLGVVAAWTIALSLGSTIVITTFHRDTGSARISLLAAPDVVVLFAATITAAITWVVLPSRLRSNSLLFVVLPLISCLVVFAGVWRHPLRKDFIQRLEKLLIPRSLLRGLP